MCWRDDVVKGRFCSFCGEAYYGGLGHRNCPSRSRPKLEDPLKEKIVAVGARHGWDEKTTPEKIKRVGEILSLDRSNSVEFLLQVIPIKNRDIIDKLDEENPPF